MWHSIEPTWGYLIEDVYLPARLTRQGMLSASFHCGTESLYAVAHKALPMMKLGEITFVTGGISFLPTDPIWLRLALRANGKDYKLSSLWEWGYGRGAPQQSLDLAHEIDLAVLEASEFMRRDDLIEKVNSLFAYNLRDTSSEASSPKISQLILDSFEDCYGGMEDDFM